MLKLICVEFKKLRRRREVLFMLLAAFIMPAVSLFYFYTHRDMLTDIGLYKQAILSFNIFLILPALLGILSATIVYREQADDVFKQLLIIPLKKEQLMLAKWAVTLVFSEAFMIISTLFTISVGLCLNLVSLDAALAKIGGSRIVVLIRLRQPEFLRRFFLGRGWGRFYRLERRTDTALYPIDFPHRFYKRNTFNRYEIVQRGAAGSFRFEVRPRTILCEGQRAVPFVAELSGPFRFEVVRLAQLHILVQIHLLRLGDFLLCHTGHTLPPYSVFLTVIYILSITIISLIIISISSV